MIRKPLSDETPILISKETWEIRSLVSSLTSLTSHFYLKDEIIIPPDIYVTLKSSVYLVVQQNTIMLLIVTNTSKYSKALENRVR